MNEFEGLDFDSAGGPGEVSTGKQVSLVAFLYSEVQSNNISVFYMMIPHDLCHGDFDWCCRHQCLHLQRHQALMRAECCFKAHSLTQMAGVA